MRIDRATWRLWKAAIFFGVTGLMGEGLFEIGVVLQPFLHPPSVPGQSKILEHFALQHVLLPLLGIAIVFSPLRLKTFFSAMLTRWYVGALLVFVTIPEVLVSMHGDLFRPYSFSSHSLLPQALQMFSIDGFTVNLIQAQHLLFAHMLLMGSIAAICARPTLLRRFAGPRTGEAVWTGAS